MLASILRSAALGAALCFGALAGPAHSKAPAPSLFGQKPNVHDAAISPDGTRLAIIQNMDGSYYIRVIDLKDPSNAKPAVGLEDGVKPKYIKWVNDGQIFVSFWQTQKMRRTVFNASFFYTIDADTMKGDILIRPREGLRQFNDEILDWLEDDPDHVIMQFADDGEDQSYPDVRKVNVETGRSSIVKRQSNRINDWTTDSAGEPRVGIGARSQGRSKFMLIRDPQTDDWTNYEKYPGLDPDTQRIIAVTDGGRSLVVSAYRGKNTRGLHRYDLVARQWAETLYQNDDYDVGGVILSKDGESIVGATFTGEEEERVLFDSYDSTYEEALALLDGFQVDFVDQSADSEKLILRVSSPNDPGGLFLFTRGGSLSKISDNRPGLEADRMGEVLSVAYTARDGQRIPAYVTLPAGLQAGQSPKDMPFIVFPHGGPFARDEKRFDYMAQFFASQGYGVLQMNFRGSEGYGKSFEDAGRNNWVVMQEDVEDGMRWLLDKGYADASRSCIAGWSYGGYAALMGAAKTPDLYNCSVAIAPLTDIPDAAQDLRDFVNGKAAADRVFAGIMKDKDVMRANNPVDVADAITVPVFMAHGTRDTSVEIDQFDRMKKRLQKAGVKGTYLRFEDEDHYMSLQKNRVKMLDELAKFLRKANGESEFAAG